MNTGKLPTALKQAHLVKIVRDDRVTISIESPAISEGNPVYRFIEQGQSQGERRGMMGFGEPGRPAVRRSVSVNVPFTEGGEVTTARFKVRIYGNAELKGKAEVVSTRGGILKDKEFSVVSK